MKAIDAEKSRTIKKTEEAEKELIDNLLKSSQKANYFNENHKILNQQISNHKIC